MIKMMLKIYQSKGGVYQCCRKLQLCYIAAWFQCCFGANTFTGGLRGNRCNDRFTTFFSVLANMGIGTAVIQNKELSDYDVSNIFTFNLYVAVGLSIIFAIFSVPLSKFYGNSVYIPIGCLLSVSLFFRQ